MLILVAEDDAHLRRGLCDLLALENFTTIAAEDGTAALAMFSRQRPDFCLLDVTMPGLDGFEVCRAIRAIDAAVPVLFLTARSDEIDRVRGFGLGADDYVAKPFSSLELISRIRAIDRRCAQRAAKPDDTFTMRDLTISPKALRAFRAGRTIELTAREAAVLALLRRRAGYVVTRDELYDHCWGRSYFANSRAVDQFIAALRRKIADVGEPRLIETVHGAGYRFDA